MTFVPCAIPICYRGPDHPHFITERDVRTALDFLVAVAATPAGVSAGGVAGLPARRLGEVERAASPRAGRTQVTRRAITAARTAAAKAPVRAASSLVSSINSGAFGSSACPALSRTVCAPDATAASAR